MRDIVVLCYHALSEDWPATLAVRPDRFEHQIELMLERGYRGATFTDAVLSRPRGKTLVVTFDDAFRSVLERAFPILERLGLPGTVFAVSSFASEGQRLGWTGIDHWSEGPYVDQLAGMSWDELRELDRAGWEVGSHTRTHPHLTELSDEELAKELVASREECAAAIGGDCPSIAYPYGAVDPRVIGGAKAAGYRVGAALPARHHRPRELEWPRVGVYWGDDLRRFKLKVSRAVRGLRLLVRR